MSLITTHVLDTSAGHPAEGIGVVLSQFDEQKPAGEVIAEAATDGDGRVGNLGPDQLPAGHYRLDFAVGEYFTARGEETFYPHVSVTFTVGTQPHYHVPLLLNPYGYSTYRGS